MKITGYGEFQQLRKSMQKDDAQVRENAERSEQAAAKAEEGSGAVSVTISPEARRKGKLRMASDFREAKVADVRARLEGGTLVTDDSVKSGTRKMLNSLFSGDL